MKPKVLGLRLLATCRGELSAVIARLTSMCTDGSGSEELECRPPSPAFL